MREKDRLDKEERFSERLGSVIRSQNIVDCAGLALQFEEDGYLGSEMRRMLIEHHHRTLAARRSR